MKSIRRTIIDKGSAGILRYLMDRYVEANDNIVEEWAKEQDRADLEIVEAQRKEVEESKAREEQAKIA